MVNSINYRTDMADERVDQYKKVNNLTALEGVEVKQSKGDSATVTTVNVLDERGEEALKRKVGSYITIETYNMNCLSDDEENEIVENVSKQIKKLINNKSGASILIVGLGNEYITPDALGPKVVKNVNITRHIINLTQELAKSNIRSVSAITPGVLGTTGIETYEIVKAVVENIKPDIVIAIDSLKSSSMHRIGNTIQISNTGIVPGAGVKNKREGLNNESLKVPVIAIGVPTVVDMGTITNEAIDKMLNKISNQINDLENVDVNKLKKIMSFFEQDTRYEMVANILDSENYILTPKEIDELIDVTSSIIGKSLNLALEII